MNLNHQTYNSETIPVPDISQAIVEMDTGVVSPQDIARIAETYMPAVQKRQVDTPCHNEPLSAQLGIQWEVAPVANVFTSAAEVSRPLYPAFGTVLAVDALNGRLLVRLLETPFQGDIIIPVKGVPGWLAQEGQEFEAQATLSATRPEEFFIGEFVGFDLEPDVNYEQALRDMAKATHVFRF